MDEYQFVKISIDNSIARITLAREPLNILNIAMMEEINSILDSLKEQTDLKVIIFDAEGSLISMAMISTKLITFFRF